MSVEVWSTAAVVVDEVQDDAGEVVIQHDSSYQISLTDLMTCQKQSNMLPIAARTTRTNRPNNPVCRYEEVWSTGVEVLDDVENDAGGSRVMQHDSSYKSPSSDDVSTIKQSNMMPIQLSTYEGSQHT